MRIEEYPVNMPEKLNDVVDEKLGMICRSQRKKRLKNCAAAMGAAAAVFAVAAVTCVTNPVMASKLPLIGHIFERMQGQITYSGDYADAVTHLAAEDAVQTGDPQNISYQRTVDGVTVTLSEVYCNGESLSMGVVVESENGFSETARSETDKTPSIVFETEEEYSFNPVSYSLGDMYYPEGDFVDAHTYAGIIRIDLKDKTEDQTKYIKTLEAGGDDSSYNGGQYHDLIKHVDVPEEFQLKLKITHIAGDLGEGGRPVNEDERGNYFDREWVCDGNWDFDLTVKRDSGRTVTVELEEASEEGFGFDKVVKTPFEITVYFNEKTKKSEEPFCIPVMLDADGLLMGEGYGYLNTRPVRSHDVSKVELYVFAYDTWSDEVESESHAKEMGLTKDKTFKELCDETCLYHTTVDFSEKKSDRDTK